MAVKNQEVMDMMRQSNKSKKDVAADIETTPAFEQDETTAPMASPMSTPEPKAGEQEKARLNIMLALDMLQQSIGMFPEKSKEAKTLEEVVRSITMSFGEREADTRQLIPAEILQMIQTLPQAGGASPAQREMAMAPAAGTTAPPLPM
jgi:hypothetical protein